jgi:hypothetical protein
MHLFADYAPEPAARHLDYGQNCGPTHGNRKIQKIQKFSFHLFRVLKVVVACLTAKRNCLGGELPQNGNVPNSPLLQMAAGGRR